MEELYQNDKPTFNFYVDFIAGCFGGIAGTIVGQPFDTVKVRLQTQGQERIYKGGIHCTIKIIKTEGVAGLFKGLTPPVAGQAGINAVIFGVQGTAMRFLEPGHNSEIIAGMMAGGAQTIVICPVELIKTKLQVQGKGERLSKSQRQFRGPLDCIAKIYKAEGFSGLYRGMKITLIRDIPAFGLYFGLYYSLLTYLKPEGKNLTDVDTISVLFAGGITGMASWCYSYPTDVIKSKFQAEGLKPFGKYDGYIDCIKSSIRNEGYRVFTRGMSVCVLRAFPVNATTFATVEGLLRLMEARREE